MDYFIFNKLKPKEQLDYIYHHCNLVAFDIIRKKYCQHGICLYYDGKMFIEVYFDGLRGDRVKEIKIYSKIQQLSYWYERVSLNSLLSGKEI